MATNRSAYKSVDEYIASFSPKVQAILEKIRMTVVKAAPHAQETISYNMPTYVQGAALAHFAAFKKHIGFYPPVRGDARLQKAVSPYTGAKGSLRFPLDQPIPYDLVERIVKLRVKQMLLSGTTQRGVPGF